MNGAPIFNLLDLLVLEFGLCYLFLSLDYSCLDSSSDFGVDVSAGQLGVMVLERLLYVIVTEYCETSVTCWYSAAFFDLPSCYGAAVFILDLHIPQIKPVW